MKIIKPSVEIMTPIDGEYILKHIEKCGRVCYKSESNITNDSAFKFIKGVIKSGHLSVIEHFSITVKFIFDRGVTHQMVRHRIASYSQESTRYCNYSKDKFNNQLTFIAPSWVDERIVGEYDIKWSGVYGHDLPINNQLDKPSNRWFWSMARAERDYNELIAEGWPPEKARSILPNSLKSEIVITANPRTFREFLQLITYKTSHPSMREVANKLLREFQNKIPVMFDDMKVID